jgi:long-chain fatty acid transport protein
MDERRTIIMKLFAKKAIPILIGMTLPVTAFATNGYFSHGYGLKAKGMGGVGVAYSQDSLAGATNPAGMVMVGARYDLGIDYFRPYRRVTGENVAYGNGALNASDYNVRSNKENFLIPEIGYNTMTSDTASMGISIVGNGGMNSTFRTNFFDVGPTKDQNATVGVDLMQLLIVMSYAFKVSDNNAIGIAPVFAYQVFEAYGLGDFGSFGFSTDANNISDNRHDTSYGGGLRLGWQGQFFKNKLVLGATASSKMYMTKFDKYQGLFAEGGSFDIPANYAIGLAYKPAESLDVAFDIERIFYSDVPAVGNRHPTGCFTGTLGCTQTQPTGTDRLGGSTGIGFGWEDQTVYKLGIAYRSSDQWTWRAGYNYGKSPIPDDQLLFGSLAPGVVEKHLTLGLTYATSKNSEWTLAYMHAFMNKQTCAAGTVSPTEAAAGTGDRGCETLFSSPGIDDSVPVLARPAGKVTAQMEQNSLGIAYGKKF